MGWIQNNSFIKITLSFFLLVSALQCGAAHALDNIKIQIYVRDDVYNDYKRFLNGRSVSEISDFSGQYTRRDVVDMILTQQALRLGGFEKEFEYQTGNFNFTNTKLLQQGKLLLSMDSYWLEDAKALEEFGLCQ